MTIKQILQQYKTEKAVSAISDNTLSILKTLQMLSIAIHRGVPEGMHGNEEVQWQKELKEIDDYATAMLGFYEMSIRGIDKRATSKLAYYFASRLIKENRYPQDVIINAYVIRSIVIFNNISDFLDYARWAKDGYYSGEMDNRQFFDIFLLANVYCGWINPIGSPQFEKIKQQSSSVANNHSNFDRTQIMRFGLEASDSVTDLIAHCLKNSSFPIVPEGCY